MATGLIAEGMRLFPTEVLTRAAATYRCCWAFSLSDIAKKLQAVDEPRQLLELYHPEAALSNSDRLAVGSEARFIAAHYGYPGS